MGGGLSKVPALQAIRKAFLALSARMLDDLEAMPPSGGAASQEA